MNNETRNITTVNSIGLAVCLSLVGDLSLFAVLPTHYADAGLTLLNLGLILSIHRLIRIPGNPLAGYIIDRWGRRKPFLLGMVFAFLSTAGYGLVHGLLPLVMARILWGIAWMFINIGALSMVIDLSQPATRGAYTGRMTAWYMVGLAVGPILGGFLVDLLTYKTAMLVCSVFPFTGLLIALRLIPDTRRAVDELPEPESVLVNGSFVSKLRALPLQVWVVFILFMVVQFSGEGIILSTLSLKLQQTIAANNGYSLGLWGLPQLAGCCWVFAPLPQRSQLLFWAASQIPALADGGGQWGNSPGIDWFRIVVYQRVTGNTALRGGPYCLRWRGGLSGHRCLAGGSGHSRPARLCDGFLFHCGRYRQHTRTVHRLRPACIQWIKQCLSAVRHPLCCFPACFVVTPFLQPWKSRHPFSLVSHPENTDVLAFS